jgi:predicted nucleic acid-binding protein
VSAHRTPRVVVDASVLIDALSSSGDVGKRARHALRGARWVGPEHLRVEAFHGIRGRLLGHKITADAADRAVQRLAQVAITTVSTVRLLDRMWELRRNLSGYDAAYVAAAEHFGVPLVTADERLAAAPGLQCRIALP